MLNAKKLWNVSIVTMSDEADAFAAPLGEGSLALSILSPPRQPSAYIEALFDELPDLPSLTAKLAVIAVLRRTKMPQIEIRETPKLDWLKKVADDFPPMPIARWIIHGSQHRTDVTSRRRALQIDATSAFGTGQHPTTRGCLHMLHRILNSPLPCRGRVRALDLGCGSGILALAWAQATHRHVIAVDLDPESVAVAKHNVRVNGLQSAVMVGWGRGYSSTLVRHNAPYDLIMSNIFAGPLCEMAKDLKRHLRPGGMAILSGILNRQANRVIAGHRMQGLCLVSRFNIGEWSVLALKRP